MKFSFTDNLFKFKFLYIKLFTTFMQVCVVLAAECSNINYERLCESFISGNNIFSVQMYMCNLKK